MRKTFTLLALSFFFSLTIFSQTLLSDFYVTNGSVSAIASIGNSVYIAGEFSYVGQNAPYGAVISSSEC
ncbi:MAG: hypothetical protein ABW007_01885 [Chitinophagaceae bacterium]